MTTRRLLGSDSPAPAGSHCSVCGGDDRPNEIMRCGICDAAFHFGSDDRAACGDVLARSNACGVTLRCGPCRDRGAGE